MSAHYRNMVRASRYLAQKIDKDMIVGKDLLT